MVTAAPSRILFFPLRLPIAPSAHPVLPSSTVTALRLIPLKDTPYDLFSKNHFHPEDRQCAASRPHRPVKFGKQMLTPAMQAGIVSKRLTFREIFTAAATLFLCVVILPLWKSPPSEDAVLRSAA